MVGLRRRSYYRRAQRRRHLQIYWRRTLFSRLAGRIRPTPVGVWQWGCGIANWLQITSLSSASCARCGFRRGPPARRSLRSRTPIRVVCYPNVRATVVSGGSEQFRVARLTFLRVTGTFAYSAIVVDDAWSRRVIGRAVGRCSTQAPSGCARSGPRRSTPARRLCAPLRPRHAVHVTALPRGASRRRPTPLDVPCRREWQLAGRRPSNTIIFICAHTGR